MYTRMEYPCTIPYHHYRPQRSCGQGNVFTGVCLSTGGEGVCLSACWDANPPGSRQTPPDQADPPGTRQTPPPPGPGRLPPDQADTPQDQADTPRPGRHPPGTRHTPIRKQTPAYGLREAGTHPTGMHSCWLNHSTPVYRCRDHQDHPAHQDHRGPTGQRVSNSLRKVFLRLMSSKLFLKKRC